MDSSNDPNTTNQKAQKQLLSIQQIEASHIIKATFCTRVDQDNAPLKCSRCECFTIQCKGRPKL